MASHIEYGIEYLDKNGDSLYIENLGENSESLAHMTATLDSDWWSKSNTPKPQGVKFVQRVVTNWEEECDE